jgi:hypothetical protein
MKLAVALTAVAAVFSAHAVRADQPGHVYLGGTCLPAGVEATALLDIVQAELAPVPVSPLSELGSRVPGNDFVVLALDACVEAPPSVRIVLWRGVERRARLVNLTDVQRPDWTRTLALALAETRANPAVSEVAEAVPVPWAPDVTTAEAATNDVPAPESAPAPTTPEGSGFPAHAARRAPSFRARATLAFRYAPSTSTPAVGAGVGLAWARVGLGAMLFGARRSVPIGETTLWVPSVTGFFDLLELGAHLRLRSSLDLGAAIATGVPNDHVSGRTTTVFHAALHGGVSGRWALGSGGDVEGGVSVGYASSLRAEADGKDALGLDGLLLTAELGLRFW